MNSSTIPALTNITSDYQQVNDTASTIETTEDTQLIKSTPQTIHNNISDDISTFDNTDSIT